MPEPKPFAFVLMPFSKEFDDIYKLGIQAVAQEHGIVAERVDEQIYRETMLERIYRQIEVADFIIADMTGRNPNVFYEVGYAHAKDKLYTLLTQRSEDIPFDLKHHRHVIYGDSIQELKRLLSIEIEWLKDEVPRRKSAILTTELRLARGTLIKERDWRDKGSLELVIDFHNPGQRRTPEIESVYFTTTKHWKFSQGGTECAHRDTEKKRQHFLAPPVARLSPNAWAQLKVTGERTLWSKYGTHEERKEEYRIVGNIIMEIVTSEGTIKEKVNLDVNFEEFPF